MSFVILQSMTQLQLEHLYVVPFVTYNKLEVTTLHSFPVIYLHATKHRQ